MSKIAQMMQAAAGAAGGGALAIEDVFSTYLYTGNQTAGRVITNGIDFSGEGGMLWIKGRTSPQSNFLFDTERGAGAYLISDTIQAQSVATSLMSSFNSDGFTLGAATNTNYNNVNFASWSWRKAPRFFDCVTYTGNGSSSRSIAHNLGVVPGLVIFKQRNSSSNWIIYHRSLGVGSKLSFDVDLPGGGSGYFVSASATDFKIGNDTWINNSGSTYVAYFFAHDPLGPSDDGSDGLISCGSFTTNSSGLIDVDLGWEPQFLLFKNTSSSGNWFMWDTMRGMSLTHQNALRPDLSSSEAQYTGGYLYPTQNGFASSSNFFGASKTVAYMAIRRGPMRQPTSGTEVFQPVAYTGTGAGTTVNTTIAPDTVIVKGRSNLGNGEHFDRLRGKDRYFYHALDYAEQSTGAQMELDRMDGFKLPVLDGYSSTSGRTYVAWAFKRAPGFFDSICYTGDGATNRTLSHNLGATPEMMIVKNRTAANDWAVYHSGLNAGVNPENYYLYLNTKDQVSASLNYWANTAPTNSSITVGSNPRVNESTKTYIAYLFASLPGISKVGRYTGNGSSQDIDCGFTAGARFVLIKHADGGTNLGSQDWAVFDTTRGIVAGGDALLKINDAASESTANDFIDPYSAGFTVNDVGTLVNRSGYEYVYLAIA